MLGGLTLLGLVGVVILVAGCGGASDLGPGPNSSTETDVLAGVLSPDATDASDARQDMNEQPVVESEGEVRTQWWWNDNAQLKVTFLRNGLPWGILGKSIAVKVVDRARTHGPQYVNVPDFERRAYWPISLSVYFENVCVGKNFTIYVDWTGTGRQYKPYLIAGGRPMLNTREITFTSWTSWRG